MTYILILQNGIMHERRFRACNRKVLVPDIASRQTLIDQSIGTAISLYHVSQLPSTTDLSGIRTFVNNTVDAFHRFIRKHNAIKILEYHEK